MEILVLMYNGIFVDTKYLGSGIYEREMPCIYKEGTTIESLIEQGRKLKEIHGDFPSDSYFENLKMCSLEKYNLTKL